MNTDGKVSIAGLDKAEVLAALYNASIPLGLGKLQYNPRSMEPVEAAALLAHSTDCHFDYVKGRVIKVWLNTDEIDPWGYDRDNGQGALAAVIATLRK